MNVFRPFFLSILGLLVFGFIYNAIFPPQKPVEIACFLDVNSQAVKVLAVETVSEMVPEVVINGSHYLYQGAAGVVSSGMYKVTQTDNANYIQPLRTPEPSKPVSRPPDSPLCGN